MGRGERRADATARRQAVRGGWHVEGLDGMLRARRLHLRRQGGPRRRPGRQVPKEALHWAGGGAVAVDEEAGGDGHRRVVVEPPHTHLRRARCDDHERPRPRRVWPPPRASRRSPLWGWSRTVPRGGVSGIMVRPRATFPARATRSAATPSAASRRAAPPGFPRFGDAFTKVPGHGPDRVHLTGEHPTLTTNYVVDDDREAAAGMHNTSLHKIRAQHAGRRHRATRATARRPGIGGSIYGAK